MFIWNLSQSNGKATLVAEGRLYANVRKEPLARARSTIGGNHDPGRASEVGRVDEVHR